MWCRHFLPMLAWVPASSHNVSEWLSFSLCQAGDLSRVYFVSHPIGDRDSPCATLTSRIGAICALQYESAQEI